LSIRLIQSAQGTSGCSLLKNLAAGMFEQVGIDLAGDAAIGVMRRPLGPAWAGWAGRAAWWRIVPKPAVPEDLADGQWRAACHDHSLLAGNRYEVMAQGLCRDISVDVPASNQKVPLTDRVLSGADGRQNGMKTSR